MKNLIPAFMFLSMLLFFSCTTMLYTHEQVIERYKTKQDVTKRFGAPTEKKTSDTTEEWLYAFEKKNSITDHSVTQLPNITTANVTAFSPHKRYLTFTFDKQGNVTRTDYQGVDLTEKKKSPGKTIALVLGAAALVVVLVVIIGNSLNYSLGNSSY